MPVAISWYYLPKHIAITKLVPGDSHVAYGSLE